MGKITNKHDSFLRKVLADKQVAIDYFRSALPAHIAGMLDFSTLEPLPGTYVSKDLQTTVSDVVYTCQRRDGRGSVHICLLVEHKSAPDKYTPVQIGGYIFSGYGQQIRQRRKQRIKQRLSPIIPILFYHGKQQWEYWTLDRLFDGLEDGLLGFLPNFDYIYANLRDTPDGVIKAMGNRYLASALLMMKHALDKRRLKELIAEILSIGLRYGSDDQGKSMVVYTFEVAELTEEEIEKVLDSLSPEDKEKVMSTYDLLIEKGAEKGRREERARAQRLIEQERAKAYAEKLKSALKMKNSGFDNAMIADVLELPIEEVEKL
ncbi:MAG: hypothetical protein EAS52_01200 [Parapedobacter sp.]|nr:MAG: hypothetical protein EAS52_01200 [Parapedobacter sp.]